MMNKKIQYNIMNLQTNPETLEKEIYAKTEKLFN